MINLLNSLEGTPTGIVHSEDKKRVIYFGAEPIPRALEILKEALTEELFDIIEEAKDEIQGQPVSRAIPTGLVRVFEGVTEMKVRSAGYTVDVFTRSEGEIYKIKMSLVSDYIVVNSIKPVI